MKPENLQPRVSQEQPSNQFGLSVEQISDPTNIEFGIKSGAERYEQRGENKAASSSASLTTFIPAPVIEEPDVVELTTISVSPLVANDDDLIEKEWVDRAKKIVAETQNNPYGREEAVNKLQVDYLKKRYGRELGVAE